MKKLLTSLLIIIYLNVNAQYLKPVGELKWSVIVTDNKFPNDYILIGYESGEIEIKGDTIKAIKYLFDFIKQVQDENEQKTICISKAVNWENTVPDSFKNTKSYKLYLQSIYKQGYRTEPVKKPKSQPKRKMQDIKVKQS